MLAVTARSLTLCLVILATTGGCTVPQLAVDCVSCVQTDIAWNHACCHGGGCRTGIIGNGECYAAGWREGYFAAASGRGMPPGVVPPEGLPHPAYSPIAVEAKWSGGLAWHEGFTDGMNVAAANGHARGAARQAAHVVDAGELVGEVYVSERVIESTPTEAAVDESIEVEVAPPGASKKSSRVGNLARKIAPAKPAAKAAE